MRTPIQCEGVERGPAKIAQIAAAGAANPASFGDLLKSALPHLKNAGLGALRGVLGD